MTDSNSQRRRVRVVMFMPPSVTFGHDWADAASRVADVVRIEMTDELSWPAVASYPVLAQNPLDPTWYQLKRALKLPRRLLGQLADLPRTARTIRALRYLQQVHGPIDVLHAHFYPSARCFPLVKRRLEIPYVVTEHSTALTLESPDKKITKRGLRIAATVYREAAVVMPVSQSLMRAIKELGLHGRFQVVSNPVDGSLFRPRGRRESSEYVELVTVARLARVKAIDVLLHAVADLQADLPTRLTVIGSGPLEGELKRLRTELGLDDVVDFLGRRSREEIADYLSNSDIFVLASRAENLPVAVIEALMSGLPVVATAVGGVPELVPPDRGRLVDKDDPVGLASAIRATITELPAHDRVAAAADALERYSMEATGLALETVYEKARTGFGHGALDNAH